MFGTSKQMIVTTITCFYIITWLYDERKKEWLYYQEA